MSMDVQKRSKHEYAQCGAPKICEAGSMRKRFHPNCFNEGANSVPFPEAGVCLQAWLSAVGDLFGHLIP